MTLPNLHPLLASCYTSESGAPADTVWKGKEEVSVEKVTSWVLATIPGITDCFAQYVRAHLQRLASYEERVNSLQASPKNSVLVLTVPSFRIQQIYIVMVGIAHYDGYMHAFHLLCY